MAEAIEAEVEKFLSKYKVLKDNQGRQRGVRNGYLPEREVQAGIGQFQVRVSKVHEVWGRD